MTEPYLSTDQLAARWGLRPSTLKSQRARGVGPPYETAERLASPLGAPRVRYLLAQILAFEAAHNITPLKPLVYLLPASFDLFLSLSYARLIMALQSPTCSAVLVRVKIKMENTLTMVLTAKFGASRLN